ncbi:placenta-specific protein 1 [Tamandua tetradactyla]|uniref:placenta-specific protein 1 n=1 Tax=Tamandua tetradactyla TaxID=48850 RepID=UPI00405468BC
MRLLGPTGGMLLLVSLFSACSGQNPVTVLCSIDWFMVTVHPLMLNNDVYVHYHELHLGLGCPANYVRPHAYQFTYRVTECGIRAKVVPQDMIIYSTELYYHSQDTSSKYVIPVSCAALQRSPWFSRPHAVSDAGESRATAHSDDTPYEVFELSRPQSSQRRPDCDCPPCIFHEDVLSQTPSLQAEVEEAQAAQPSYFGDNAVDWSLSSEDLLEPM